MQSIQARLQRAEQDLLSAIVEGTHAMNAFNIAWSDLFHDFDNAAKLGLLDEESISLAHAVSTRVAIVAAAFHDTDMDYFDLTDGLMHDLEISLSRLSLSDASVPVALKRPRREYLMDRVCAVESMESTAISWLLSNLHNPYPSHAIREAIARVSNVEEADVAKWFKHTRNQIGWNALRDSQYGGSRRAVVRAARAAFDVSQECSLAKAEVDTFSTLKANMVPLLNSLYHTPEHASPVTLVTPDFMNTVDFSDHRYGSYCTSPQISSTPSPRVPSLSFSSDESEADVLNREHVVSRKRRRVSLTNSESRCDNLPTIKRLRLMTPLLVSGAGPNLMLQGNEPLSRPLVQRSTGSAVTTEHLDYHQRGRKRRSKDEGSDVLTKRARIASGAPDVSIDPFMSYLPQSPLVEENAIFGSDAPLDVEIFSDWHSLEAFNPECLSLEMAQCVDFVTTSGPDTAALTSTDTLSTISPIALDPDDLVHTLLDDSVLVHGGLERLEEAAAISSVVQPPDSSIFPAYSSPPALFTVTDALSTQPGRTDTSGACPTQGIDDSLWCTSFSDSEFFDLLQNLPSTSGTPPPSFSESVENAHAADWSDLTNIPTYLYDVIAPPPPPYEDVEWVGGWATTAISAAKFADMSHADCLATQEKQQGHHSLQSVTTVADFD